MDAPPSPGRLIAVEGIDGAGKSTQIERLARALRDSGVDVVCSKEPTDGAWGKKLRESALTGRMSLDEELEYFIQDRRQHVRELIGPALAAGDTVLLDRYFYSTIAYQGARGADVAALTEQMVAEFPLPEIVFLIDVSPEVGLHRVAQSRGDVPNEFERAESLRDVREVFLSLEQARPEVERIDGRPSEDAVFGEIMKRLASLESSR